MLDVIDEEDSNFRKYSNDLTGDPDVKHVLTYILAVLCSSKSLQLRRKQPNLFIRCSVTPSITERTPMLYRTT